MADTLIGKKIGQYEIVAKIGEGGMAQVYKAYQASMNRYVAIKVLPHQSTQDTNFIKRFKGEAQAIANLEHSHILPVHDFGLQDDIYYLVMRYIDSGTLADLMKQDKALPVERSLQIIIDVAKALDYAHSQGIIHRDIKPSNILIDPHGDVLLSDFGLAKMITETNETRLTKTGMVVGTPDYMSPEQATDEPIDGSSDIYSLGVVLYELLTGQLPFDGTTPMSVVIKHVREPVPPPRQVNPTIPEGLEQIIMQAMAKKPSQRYQSAGEFAQALQQALANPQMGPETSQPIAPSPPAESPNLPKATAVLPKDDNSDKTVPTQKIPVRAGPSKPLIFGVVGIVAVILIGLGIWFARPWLFGPPPARPIFAEPFLNNNHNWFTGEQMDPCYIYQASLVEGRYQIQVIPRDETEDIADLLYEQLDLARENERADKTLIEDVEEWLEETDDPTLENFLDNFEDDGFVWCGLHYFPRQENAEKITIPPGDFTISLELLFKETNEVIDAGIYIKAPTDESTSSDNILEVRIDSAGYFFVEGSIDDERVAAYNEPIANFDRQNPTLLTIQVKSPRIEFLVNGESILDDHIGRATFSQTELEFLIELFEPGHEVILQIDDLMITRP